MILTRSTNAQRRAWAKGFARGYRAEAQNWKQSVRATHPSPAYLAGVAAAKAENAGAPQELTSNVIWSRRSGIEPTTPPHLPKIA
jgi:hypothetical protein